MPNVHVIMPFNRPQWTNTLLSNLAPLKVFWHPISTFPLDLPHLSWIRPCFCPDPIPNADPCYWKLNYWLDHNTIGETSDLMEWIQPSPLQPDDFYCFLGDDDLYGSPTFMDEIRNSPGDVVMVGMDRSFSGGQKRHIARPENMKRGSVGLQQYFVRGHILRDMRFQNCESADGWFAEELVKKYEVTYRDDLRVLYNFLLPKYWR